MSGWRDRVVDIVADLIGRWYGVARRRGQSCVLAYHNIVPEATTAGDRSLHLPIERFRRQLDLLQEACEIVPLDEVLAPTSPAARPRVAITFDDAYAGAVGLGFTELRQRGLAATLFVAPGLLGCATTWWDALAAHWLEGRTSADLRDQALAAGGAANVVAQLASDAGLPWNAAPSTHAIASLEQLRAALWPALTLGAHTWSHVNLERYTSGWAAQELEAPLQWLQREFGTQARRWLALPYGLGGSQVESAAAHAGYVRVFRVEGGWRLSQRTNPMAEPRVNVPAGASPGRFRRLLLAPAAQTAAV